MAHPFNRLLELIEEYTENKQKMTVEELQTMREDISLNLFLMNDSAAKAISNYDAEDYKRKRFYAERQEHYRGKQNENGKLYTVADSERLARLEAKDVDDRVVEALRQKERVRLIITATKEILNAIAGRISQINNR